VRKLVDLTTEVHAVEWAPNLDIGNPDNLAGVLFVGPVKSTGVRPAVTRLAEQLDAAEVPLFVVVPDGTEDRAVRALYRAGAAVVLTWPAEARQLGSLVAESLGTNIVRGTPDSSDQALVRSVKLRLREDNPLPPGLRISARQGVVEFSGEVDTLPRKERLLGAVARVQGVTGTVADHLVVAPSGRSDRAVSKDVRMVLHAVSSDVSETVSADVRNGYVTIAGSTADRTEMNRLIDVVANVRGVRGVRNYTTVSAEQKASDRALTRRVRRMLNDRFPRERVDATVFGSVAVLSGKVARLAIKRDLESTVLDHPAVGRVVNKVAVT
jgi:osmotically-inducible protein OsmY